MHKYNTYTKCSHINNVDIRMSTYLFVTSRLFLIHHHIILLTHFEYCTNGSLRRHHSNPRSRSSLNFASSIFHIRNMHRVLALYPGKSFGLKFIPRQSVSSRFIPKSLFPRQSELIRINPKKVFNLVWCNPVKN